LNDNIKRSCVLLNLWKTFNCIQGSILVDNLHNYGVRGIPHKLMKSYLTNRTQHTHNICKVAPLLDKEFLKDRFLVHCFSFYG
jgi:hypothetical protein